MPSPSWQLTQALRFILKQQSVAISSARGTAAATSSDPISSLSPSSSYASCPSAAKLPARSAPPPSLWHRATQPPPVMPITPPSSPFQTATLPAARQVLGHRGFFGGASSSPSGPDAQPDKAALQDAEKMLSLMASSPQMQQMMMRMLPPDARSPETMQLILQDPGMKQKLVQMLAKQKLPSHLLHKMTSGDMEQTFDRAAKMGVNPQELFTKLMSQPQLLAKLQQPKIMSVFMDVTANPQNMSKYKDDPETLEVIRDIRAALSSAGGAPTPSPAPSSAEPGPPTIALPADASAVAQPPGPSSSPASGASPIYQPPPVVDAQHSDLPPPPGSPPPPGTPASTGPGAAPFVPNLAGISGSSAVLSLMMSDPELMKRMQNPKVQAALMDISKSPWNTVKYLFDREVMQVFSALNNLMRGKDPWTGKKKGAAAPGGK